MAFPQRAKEQAAAPPQAAEALLDERYQISVDGALPEWDSPAAKAFAAVDLQRSTVPLFALVCEPAMPARTELMTVLRRFERPAMLRLVDWGFVPWGEGGSRRVVAIFEQPAGARLTPSLEMPVPPMTVERIAEQALRPIATALRILVGPKSAHRAIRPDNLFHGATSKAPLVLGECVTAPAGLHQPVLFESIERGMAEPAGRGAGDVGDDLYAAGVLALYLLLGQDPAAGKSDEEILAAKLELGSYAALVGDRQIPRELMEPLRGLLQDEPRARWSLDDLDQWLGGHRTRVRKPVPQSRAARPFSFNGKSYLDTRALALAFGRDWKAASLAVSDPRLAKWIERAVREDLREEALAVTAAAKVRRASASLGAGGDSRLVANACLVLDPSGPIRLNGMSIMADGLGTALAAARDDPARMKDVAEILRLELPLLWYRLQHGGGFVGPNWERRMRRLSQYLKQAGPGYGVERCLYELNPSLPCQSPVLRDAHVIGLDDFLAALEAYAATADHDGLPLDRHMAAFVGARCGGDVESALAALGDRNDGARVAAGAIALLGVVQKRTRIRNLPHLSRWMGKLTAPVIAGFRNRPLRQKLRAQAASMVKAGSLSGLHKILVNDRLRRWDANAATLARAEFTALNTEIARYEVGARQYILRARSTGHLIAAFLSGAIALWALVALVLNYVA